MFLYLLNIYFWNTKVSQGNVATHLRCDGIFNHHFIVIEFYSKSTNHQKVSILQFWEIPEKFLEPDVDLHHHPNLLYCDQTYPSYLWPLPTFETISSKAIIIFRELNKLHFYPNSLWQFWMELFAKSILTCIDLDLESMQGHSKCGWMVHGLCTIS